MSGRIPVGRGMKQGDPSNSMSLEITKKNTQITSYMSQSRRPVEAYALESFNFGDGFQVFQSLHITNPKAN